jgi:hypothetical protein
MESLRFEFERVKERSFDLLQTRSIFLRMSKTFKFII